MTFKDLIEKNNCKVYHLEPKLENQQVVNVIAGDLMSEVLVEDEKIRNSRGYLCFAVQTVIKLGAKLLGIDMPQEM